MADINPSRPTQDTTPAEIIAAAFSWLPRQVQRNRIATEALDALKAAGYTVVKDAERESHWGPKSVPVLDDDGNPVMDDRMVPTLPKHTFLWGYRERWVTPWEEVGEWITSEEYNRQLGVGRG